MNTIEERLKKIIEKYAKVGIHEVKNLDKIDLINDLRFDATCMNDFINDIESEFKFDFDDRNRNFDYIRNLKNLKNYILNYAAPDEY